MWSAIAFAVVIAGLAVFYVALPLWQTRNHLLVDDNHPVADLLQRKDAALRAIKEIEFDYNTGKLDIEDFERLNQRLRQQAATFIQRIESIAPDNSLIEAELEATIASKRRTQDTSKLKSE